MSTLLAVGPSLNHVLVSRDHRHHRDQVAVSTGEAPPPADDTSLGQRVWILYTALQFVQCRQSRLNHIASTGLLIAHELNWSKPEFSNCPVNGRVGIHVLRTNRALTVLVFFQPISTKYSRDSHVHDLRTCRATGSTYSVQFLCCKDSSSLYAVNKP